MLTLSGQPTRMQPMCLAPAQVSAYRLKLPPKRIFLHIQTPEFVEERRQQLDQYLQALLGAGSLSNMPQVGTCHGLRVVAACVLPGPCAAHCRRAGGALGCPVPTKAGVMHMQEAAWGAQGERCAVQCQCRHCQCACSHCWWPQGTTRATCRRVLTESPVPGSVGSQAMPHI